MQQLSARQSSASATGRAAQRYAVPALARPALSLNSAPLPRCRAPLHTAPIAHRPAADVSCAAAAAAAPLPDAGAPASGGGLSKALANLRATFFYLWTLALSLPLFVAMLALAPAVAALDRHRRLAQHWVNNVWAKVSTFPFYRIEIQGREHLPPAGSPAVYIANHQSFLDIFSLFHLDRSFKFVSKTSNFLIPIIGWSMFLTGHVMLNRVDRRSQLKCLQQCGELLGKGASVLFFPEGTRSRDRVMAAFKKGAFSVAVKAGVPVVPITLIGTGDLMPNAREGELYPGTVRIVVHPPIACGKGTNADAVCTAARAAVASALPPELVGSADASADSE